MGHYFKEDQVQCLYNNKTFSLENAPKRDLSFYIGYSTRSYSSCVVTNRYLGN